MYAKLLVVGATADEFASHSVHSRLANYRRLSLIRPCRKAAASEINLKEMTP